MMFAKPENTVGKDAPDTCFTYQEIIAKDLPDDDASTYASVSVNPAVDPFERHTGWP